MDAYAQANGEDGGVILNLNRLENGRGIRLLVTLLIRAQQQGQRLLACGLNDHDVG